nr:DNA helicase PIF1, ATP-dependent [Tanacetum cinerariifolium]
MVDEIKNYLNYRYLTPCEAVWRIFSFDIHRSYPSVMKLNFHLQNQQPVTLHDTDCLSALLQKEGINVIMFTDWFDLNERHPPVRTLTYAQIPKHYVWHKQEKKWRPRKQRKCIGGIGKTLLYKTTISRLRSELKILLAVASSGIASLLLPGGRTAHNRQILLVIPKGKRADIVQACINRSELWKHCKVSTLKRSMRVNEYTLNGDIDTRKQTFNQWVLAVGDGKVPARIKDGEDEPTWIEIPETFLIPSS